MVVLHDSYDAPSYLHIGPDDWRLIDQVDWSEEAFILRCYNREQAGFEVMPWLDMPQWLADGLAALRNFAMMDMQRKRDMEGNNG